MVALFLYAVVFIGRFLLNRETGNKLIDDIESLTNNLGFSIVEVNSSTNRNRLKINAIIYSGKGVKIDDCATVHKTIFPRLEVIYDKFDVYLEVSSPGIERNFKDAREFEVFKGKAVKIMYDDKNDWELGIIESVENDSVIIDFDKNNQTIKFSDIHKCKLDYLKGVRKS